jgi:hypothetical protein
VNVSLKLEPCIFQQQFSLLTCDAPTTFFLSQLIASWKVIFYFTHSGLWFFAQLLRLVPKIYLTQPHLESQLHKMALCMNRLNEERKQWRRDHPFGFYAKPQRNAQGVLDLKVWECGIPGKEKTLWEGGLFKLSVIFPDGELITATPSQNEY